jgi:NADPH-dependent curcumin reductase CurA
MEGFLVSQFAPQFDTALRQLHTWLTQGRLHYREDIAEGLDAAPAAFIRMLEGKTKGKQLIKIAG